MTPLDRHERAVLQFSGGKDSLAILHLLRPFWDRLIVMWVNTGAAFPETIRQMADIRALVPHFLEVHSDQPANVREEGQPSDLLSWWDTRLGRSLDSSRTFRMQSPFQCCLRNIWEPMYAATKRTGATLVIRGQRNAEVRKGPARSGIVEDGIEYWFPIEDWSDLQVREFLLGIDVPLPENYGFVNSSLDCWSCTAYLNENAGKFRYMKERHPTLHAQVKVALDDLVRAARAELDNFEGAMR